MNAALIVVAAGVGSRLGAAVHKALVPIAGRPLVEHTLLRLSSLDWLDPLVLVGHPDDRVALRELATRLPRDVRLVDGGARRQDSVAAGLAALDVGGPSVVLVHDGARPFVPLRALPGLVRAASDHGCALLAVPVADTVKRARDDDPLLVDRSVPRQGLWAAQTPQAFQRTRLLELLERAGRDGVEVTDEASLFESAGLPVRLVEGSRLNVKITTEDDLLLAAALLGAPPTKALP